MLQTLGLVAIAVAPGFFLLSYVYLRDRYEREPLGLVLRTFFLGALAALPVLVLGTMVAEPAAADMNLTPFARTVWDSFITAGLLEETAKLGAVWLVAYRSKHFNEPYDGIVYATAASLGLASLENVLYVWNGGMNVAVGRALLSVPGHALFGMIMGYYLGIAKFARPLRAATSWLLALSVPIVLHGLYDVLLFNADYQVAGYLLYPLVAFLWVRGTQSMTRHVTASPFRTPMHVQPEMNGRSRPCPSCGKPAVAGAAYCHHCGARLAGSPSAPGVRE